MLRGPGGSFRRKEPYIIEEDPLPEDAFPAEEVSQEDPMATEQVAPEATLELSQAKVIIEGFDDAEEHPLSQHDNIPHDLDNLCEPVPCPDIAPKHYTPAKDAKFPVTPRRPAFSDMRDGCGVRSPLRPPSSTVPVPEAAALEAPTEISHTINAQPSQRQQGPQIYRLYYSLHPDGNIERSKGIFCGKCTGRSKIWETASKRMEFDLGVV